mgnify:CR=1 FL=1
MKQVKKENVDFESPSIRTNLAHMHATLNILEKISQEFLNNKTTLFF